MKKTIPLAALVLVLAGCSGGGDAASTPAPSMTVEVPSEGSATASAPEEVVEGEGMDLPTWTAGDPAATFTCTSPEMEGVVYTIPLPVDASHPAIVEMESLRTELGVEEVPNYVVVEIDASKGGPEVERGSLYTASWATADFETVEGMSTGNMIDVWSESLDVENNDDINLYNRAVDVNNSLLNTEPNRGAKGFTLLVFDDPVESVVAPMIQTDGFTTITCDLA